MQGGFDELLRAGIESSPKLVSKNFLAQLTSIINRGANFPRSLQLQISPRKYFLRNFKMAAMDIDAPTSITSSSRIPHTSAT